MVPRGLEDALEEGRLCVLCGEEVAALSGIPRWREVHLAALYVLSEVVDRAFGQVSNFNIRDFAATIPTDLLARTLKANAGRCGYLAETSRNYGEVPNRIHLGIAHSAELGKIKSVFAIGEDFLVLEATSIPSVFATASRRKILFQDEGLPFFELDRHGIVSQGLSLADDEEARLQAERLRRTWAPFVSGSDLLVLGLSADDLPHNGVGDVLYDFSTCGKRIWWVHALGEKPALPDEIAESITFIESDLLAFSAEMFPAQAREEAPLADLDLASMIEEWFQDNDIGEWEAAATLFELYVSKPGPMGAAELEMRWWRILETILLSGSGCPVDRLPFLQAAMRYYTRLGAVSEASKCGDLAQQLFDRDSKNFETMDEAIRHLGGSRLLRDQAHLRHLSNKDVDFVGPLLSTYQLGDKREMLETLCVVFDGFSEDHAGIAAIYAETCARLAKEEGLLALSVDFKLQQARGHLWRHEHRLVEAILEDVEPLIPQLPSPDRYEQSAELLSAAIHLRQGEVAGGLRRLANLSTRKWVQNSISSAVNWLLDSMGVYQGKFYFEGLTHAEVDAYLSTYNAAVEKGGLPFEADFFACLPLESGEGAREITQDMAFAIFQGEGIGVTQVFVILLALESLAAKRFTEALYTATNTLREPEIGALMEANMTSVCAVAYGQQGDIHKASRWFRKGAELYEACGVPIPAPFIQYGLTHWAQLEDMVTFRAWCHRAAKSFAVMDNGLEQAENFLTALHHINPPAEDFLRDALRDIVDQDYDRSARPGTSEYFFGELGIYHDIDPRAEDLIKEIRELGTKQDIETAARRLLDSCSPKDVSVASRRAIHEAFLNILPVGIEVHQLQEVFAQLAGPFQYWHAYDYLLYWHLTLVEGAALEGNLVFARNQLRRGEMYAHLASDNQARVAFLYWKEYLDNYGVPLDLPLTYERSAHYLRVPGSDLAGPNEALLDEKYEEHVATFLETIEVRGGAAGQLTLATMREKFKQDSVAVFPLVLHLLEQLIPALQKEGGKEAGVEEIITLTTSYRVLGQSGDSVMWARHFARHLAKHGEPRVAIAYMQEAERYCETEPEVSFVERVIGALYLEWATATKPWDLNLLESARSYLSASTIHARPHSQASGLGFLGVSRVFGQMGHQQTAVNSFSHAVAALLGTGHPAGLHLAALRGTLLTPKDWAGLELIY